MGFAGDHVEVQGYVDLKTTFSDKKASRTIVIRYIVVNTPSSYNLVLGRPYINRLDAVASTKHMKMRLPSEEGKVITIRSNQKAARKCYESSLENRRSLNSTPFVHEGKVAEVLETVVGKRQRPTPAGEV